jgi:hypothetical protein
VADFSYDSLGRAVGASITGVTATNPGSTSNSLLGSVADVSCKVGTSVVTGALQSANDTVTAMVGGQANMQALTGAATKVSGTVIDLFKGNTSVSDVYSEVKGKLSTLVDGDPVTSVASVISGPVGNNLLGMTGLSGLNNDLGSDWGNLSQVLMARIFVCDAKGVADTLEFAGVYGPLVEGGSINITQNWQSPFENSGPETKAPTLTGMLQTGGLVPVLNALQAISPFKEGAIADTLDAGSDKLKSVMLDLQGRTGVTKLNSRQVFAGMPPVKFTFGIRFRAITSALTEVEAPLARLLEWVFPQELAEDGILSEVLQTTKDVDSFIKALFPSKAPKLLALTHGGRTYPPAVIESIDYPLDAPRDAQGNYIDLTVQISMSTLTALDRPDIRKYFSRQ